MNIRSAILALPNTHKYLHCYNLSVFQRVKKLHLEQIQLHPLNTIQADQQTLLWNYHVHRSVQLLTSRHVRSNTLTVTKGYYR